MSRLALLTLLALWIARWGRWLAGLLRHIRRLPPRPPRRAGQRVAAPAPRRHHRSKPEWVHEELQSLAARAPSLSCRKLEELFNRRHRQGSAQAPKGMTVGHDFVAKVFKHEQAAIQLKRQALNQRTYTPGKPNRVWGMDGTSKTVEQGALHFLLGIVDHGTRRCLTLKALKDKCSITIVRVLCDAIERHGKPRAIRTDNETIFQSRLLKTALGLLGIRHETTELHCPWQNGRIERFFGTLKARLDQWAVPDRTGLNASLVVFRLWYNHVRPHQHLQGLTPAEAWDGVDLRRPPHHRLWFEGWGGLLQGEYLQR